MDFSYCYTLKSLKNLFKSKRVSKAKVLEFLKAWVYMVLLNGEDTDVSHLLKEISAILGLEEHYVFEFYKGIFEFSNRIDCFEENSLKEKHRNKKIEQRAEEIEESKTKSKSRKRKKTSEVTLDKSQVEIKRKEQNSTLKSYLVNGFSVLYEYSRGNPEPPQWQYLGTSDYSNLDKSDAPQLLCECTGKDSLCRSTLMCKCSEFYYSKFSMHGPLLKYHEIIQILPLELKKYDLYECSDRCKCDKMMCSLTMFPINNSTSLYLKYFRNKWRVFTEKPILKGEIVLEFSGDLHSSQKENSIKIDKETYLCTDRSNIVKFIQPSETPNLDSIRVFSYLEGRAICRLVLHSTCSIKPCTELKIPAKLTN